MSPLNPASLVEYSQHSKATLELLELDIDRNFIGYIVQTTVDTVAYAYDGPSTSESDSESRGQSKSRSNEHASFTEFVSNVITRSGVTVGAVLVALVYIERAKPYLTVETMEWAHERVFLGALMLASKYTNDCSMSNTHWSLVTGTFGKGDVGRIEREFLDTLDYELGISESEILDHHHSLVALRPRSHLRVRQASSSVNRRAISPASSEDYSSSSDNSAPSTPSPLTPLTPAYQPRTTKSDEFALQLSHFSDAHIPSLPMAAQIHAAT